MKSAAEIITVVVPVHNRERLVLETLDSIASQTALPSLIIVDNNSSDSSLQAISNWTASHRSAAFPISVLSQPEPGATNARNLGLKNTTTPWVLFFDSDDLMLPNHIEHIMQAAESNRHATLIGWDTIVQPLEGKPYRKEFKGNNLIWRNIFNGIMSTQQYAAKTQLFHDCGGWNPVLAGWNDYELGMRLLLQKPKTVYIKHKPEVIVRCQRNSITGTNFSSATDKWEKSLDSCQLIFEKAHQPYYARCINLKRAVLAGLYLRENNITESDRLLKKVLSLEPRKWHRLILRIACRFTAAGGRGFHYLYP